MPASYTITFACYNQLAYTQKFIHSLDRAEVDFSRIVAVDNGSTDGTRSWLQEQGFGAVILNNRNLGCGAAWNQGALAIQSDWTVVMNNDVICAPGWLTQLLGVAERQGLKMASPSMIEGELDYDFPHMVMQATERMQAHVRRGLAHAVCLAVHQDVWDELGYFLPIPRLMGLEDTIFFQRASEAGIPAGITSQSWLHHYGQTTQRAIRIERELDAWASLGDRSMMHDYLQLSWWGRRMSRRARRQLVERSLADEMARFGMSVHGIRGQAPGQFDWR